jgi:hypothetical protein
MEVPEGRADQTLGIITMRWEESEKVRVRKYAVGACVSESGFGIFHKMMSRWMFVSIWR